MEEAAHYTPELAVAARARIKRRAVEMLATNEKKKNQRVAVAVYIVVVEVEMTIPKKK